MYHRCGPYLLPAFELSRLSVPPSVILVLKINSILIPVSVLSRVIILVQVLISVIK